MTTIDIKKNDKVVRCTENPFTGEMMTLTVREWTLEELLEERVRLNEQMAQNYHERRKLEEEERTLIQSMNFRDFQTNGNTKHDKMMQMDATIKDMRKLEDVQTNMREGMEGAIRYYIAERFNSAVKSVLPKYVGKKCGPKTYDKFRSEVAQEMGLPEVHFCMSNSHVDFYGSGIPVNDCYVYERDSLTDNDNRFKDEYKLHRVMDGWDGLYPDNWEEWATQVIEANEQIQSAFDDYVQKQDKLVDMLKIGNVGMKRVYSYSLKEVR